MLWKGGAEGFQNSDWCSEVKMGISACFTIRARCSSPCSGSAQQWYTVVSLQEFPCCTGQSVYWSPCQLPVLDEDRSSGDLLVVQEYQPHGQYLCGSVCIVEWSHGIRCNCAVYGKGPSSLNVCLYFTQLGPSLSLDSEARSANTFLLPMLCSHQFCEYPEGLGCQERMVEEKWSRMRGGATGVSMVFTGNCTCCAVNSHSNVWIELSDHVIKICSVAMSNDLTGLWMEVIFHLLCFSWASGFSRKPGKWCPKFLAPRRAQLQPAGLSSLCVRSLWG